MGASTCTNATPSGQALGYDALRRLISWQNASTSPTATGAYAYDGSGSRVWQQDTSTTGGVTTTTTTTYILGFAEITSTQTGQAAASTTATRFYPLVGGVSALRDAAGLSYVASDQLGTPLATLNLDTGAVLGEQLRAPYGQARYAASAPTNGGMRTTYGFTGQREDASAAGSSGLDYFNARYYDPVIGRFTSPDSLTDSDPLLDSYAYVGGQVESAADLSGHQTMTLQGGFSVGARTAAVGIGILGLFGGVAVGVVAGGLRDIGNGQTANITVYSNGNVNVEIDGSDGFEVSSNTYGPGSAGYARYMALLSAGTAVTDAVISRGVLADHGFPISKPIPVTQTGTPTPVTQAGSSGQGVTVTQTGGATQGIPVTHADPVTLVQGVQPQGIQTDGLPHIDAGNAGKHIIFHKSWTNLPASQRFGKSLWNTDLDVAAETRLAWNNGNQDPKDPNRRCYSAGGSIGGVLSKAAGWIEAAFIVVEINPNTGAVHGWPRVKPC